jgi:hypothetical protein
MTSQLHWGGVSTETLEHLRANDRDCGPRIVHLRDWDLFDATGEIRALCGKRIKGVPAHGQSCVVCRELGAQGRFATR